MTMIAPAALSLTQRRASIRDAYEAATAARVARSSADESARMAGALADRRSAADGLVADSNRRLRAVRGMHVTRLVFAVRGRLRSEVAVRSSEHVAAVADRDAVVAKVHAYQRDAERLDAEAGTASARAATLPRMLDEIALLVRAAGGDGALQLAASEAAIEPVLCREVELTAAVRATRTAQDRIRAAVTELTSAHAWGQYDRSFGQPDRRGGTNAGRDAAVAELRRQLGAAARSQPRVVDEVSLQSLLTAARELLVRLGSQCDEVEAERSEVRHELASARAARTAILLGLA